MPDPTFLLAFFFWGNNLDFLTAGRTPDLMGMKKWRKQRTGLVRVMSSQSTAMLNTHYTFLRMGYRAHLQISQEMKACTGIPAPFYKCSPKMQRVWVKTSDSNVKEIATKEGCTIYSETLTLQKTKKKLRRRLKKGDMHITALMSSILGRSGSWH